jgi:hypothetical protein
VRERGGISQGSTWRRLAHRHERGAKAKGGRRWQQREMRAEGSYPLNSCLPFTDRWLSLYREDNDP